MPSHTPAERLRRGATPIGFGGGPGAATTILQSIAQGQEARRQREQEEKEQAIINALRQARLKSAEGGERRAEERLGLERERFAVQQEASKAEEQQREQKIEAMTQRLLATGGFEDEEEARQAAIAGETPDTLQQRRLRDIRGQVQSLKLQDRRLVDRAFSDPASAMVFRNPRVQPAVAAEVSGLSPAEVVRARALGQELGLVDEFTGPDTREPSKRAIRAEARSKADELVEEQGSPEAALDAFVQSFGGVIDPQSGKILGDLQPAQAIMLEEMLIELKNQTIKGGKADPVAEFRESLEENA